MKKLIFTLLVGTLAFGQTSNLEFAGLWKPTGTNKVTTLFWHDQNNTLQVKLEDNRDCESLRIISVKLIGDSVIVEAVCKSNEWYSSSVYSLEYGTGMLRCVVTNALGSFESYFEKQNNN